MGTSRITRTLAAGVLALAGLVAVTPAASACSLIGEDVTITPSTVLPGDEVTVRGEGVYYFEAPLGADCSGLATYSGPLEIGVRDPLAPDAEIVVLGPAAADAEGDIAPTPLTIPADLPPRTYSVVLLIDAGEDMPGGYPSRNALVVLAPQLPVPSTELTTTTTATPTTSAPTPTTTSPVATVQPTFAG